jgi:hypothetical protein
MCETKRRPGLWEPKTKSIHKLGYNARTVRLIVVALIVTECSKYPYVLVSIAGVILNGLVPVAMQFKFCTIF